jgi:hypothetical protein
VRERAGSPKEPSRAPSPGPRAENVGNVGDSLTRALNLNTIELKPQAAQSRTSSFAFPRAAARTRRPAGKQANWCVPLWRMGTRFAGISEGLVFENKRFQILTRASSQKTTKRVQYETSG